MIKLILCLILPLSIPSMPETAKGVNGTDQPKENNVQ